LDRAIMTFSPLCRIALAATMLAMPVWLPAQVPPTLRVTLRGEGHVYHAGQPPLPLNNGETALLVEGSAVATTQAASIVALPRGARVVLGQSSQATWRGDDAMRLDTGGAELISQVDGAGSVEAVGFSVSPMDSSATRVTGEQVVAIVALQPDGTAYVRSQQGAVAIRHMASGRRGVLASGEATVLRPIDAGAGTKMVQLPDDAMPPAEEASAPVNVEEDDAPTQEEDDDDEAGLILEDAGGEEAFTLFGLPGPAVVGTVVVVGVTGGTVAVVDATSEDEQKNEDDPPPPDRDPVSVVAPTPTPQPTMPPHDTPPPKDTPIPT